MYKRLGMVIDCLIVSSRATIEHSCGLRGSLMEKVPTFCLVACMKLFAI